MNSEQSIDAWFEVHQQELLDFISLLVQTPSEVRPPHPGGELACQKIVATAYRQAGASVDVFTPDETPGLRQHPAFYGEWDGQPRSFENRPVVVGVFKGSGEGRSLLFSTHVDTVSRNPLPWHEADPFSGAIKAGKLYGRGSWDTKWGIAVSLFAMKCISSLGISLRGNVILESVPDEEYAGSHGVLAARLRGYNADFAINAEPTGMLVAPAHRGGRAWKIIVRGDAGMSFGDRKLRNPVYKLARVIEAVRQFDLERNARLSPPRFYETDPHLPAYTWQIGGGGDTFAEASGIPAECYLIAWVEEHPGTDERTHNQNFTGFINDFLRNDPDFDGIFPEYRYHFRFIPGSEVDTRHPFFTTLENAFTQAGIKYHLGGAPFACDTYIFNLHSPTPALTLGPRGGNAHGADEFVLVEDVLALARIYARTILYWCGYARKSVSLNA